VSILDYLWSRWLDASLDGPGFVALVMLAMRRADTDNLAALAGAFPEIARELRRRYDSPAGLLESDQLTIDQALEIGERIGAQARALLGGRP
jgi:hypothetical protein